MDCPDLFGSFLTARMGVSVGRLPQEVLLEEFYRSECSETVRGGRVRVFQELPAVFNCSVLAFGVQWSSIVNRTPSTLQYENKQPKFQPLLHRKIHYFLLLLSHSTAAKSSFPSEPSFWRKLFKHSKRIPFLSFITQYSLPSNLSWNCIHSSHRRSQTFASGCALFTDNL
jgi:hypothetical protein